MASFNRVILMGNITRDIELRYTPGGMPVTDVGLAVNDRRKGQNGEWIDETTFVDVTFFGRTAEVASEFLSKGSPVFVEGKLKYDTWEKDGEKKSRLRVICDRMQLIGPKAGSSPSGTVPPPRSGNAGSQERFAERSSNVDHAMESSESYSSEIPF